MKDWPLAGDEGRWRRLCLQELRGGQKLKRRRRAQGQPPGGGPAPLPEHVRRRPGGSRPCGRPERPETGSGAGLPPGDQPPLSPDEGPPPTFPEPSLPSRGASGPPPALPGALASLSHVLYAGGGPRSEPSASPRPRPGEAGGVGGPEIKALQQTRRLLANARERTRVHTISAAFEALRKQVPCYSYGQKLSKLAILRIACNYILSLARLADLDYSADHSNLSFSECVEQCTRTLQAEGRSKKRKE